MKLPLRADRREAHAEFAADDIDEEADGLLQIGHRDAGVILPAQAGNSASVHRWFF
ncbi:MAG TPA: hypothetical protein VGM74_02905 [Burkholderiaceae bacterium]